MQEHGDTKDMNIVVLAAGPPKPNRNRHLEIFEGVPLIDTVIERCRVDDTKLYIVVDAENAELRNHVNNIPNIQILFPKNKKIYSTFKAALAPEGDCVMVSGDLIDLREGNVERFVNSEYECILTGTKWGPNIVRRDLIRRGDMGDCIFKISQKYKSNFLSEENLNAAIKYHKMFYPNRTPSELIYNDIGTHMTYAFFKEIWGNPNCDSFGEKGLVFFDHYVGKDND